MKIRSDCGDPADGGRDLFVYVNNSGRSSGPHAPHTFMSTSTLRIPVFTSA